MLFAFVVVAFCRDLRHSSADRYRSLADQHLANSSMRRAASMANRRYGSADRPLRCPSRHRPVRKTACRWLQQNICVIGFRWHPGEQRTWEQGTPGSTASKREASLSRVTAFRWKAQWLQEPISLLDEGNTQTAFDLSGPTTHPPLNEWRNKKRRVNLIWEETERSSWVTGASYRRRRPLMLSRHCLPLPTRASGRSADKVQVLVDDVDAGKPSNLAKPLPKTGDQGHGSH